LKVAFRLDEQGRPACDVAYRRAAVASVELGLSFVGARPLHDDLRLVGVRRQTRDQTYSIPIGKASSARDHHHELAVTLEETRPPRRRLQIIFRAFDDGVALRYLLEKQDALAAFVLSDELTQFTFPNDPTAHLLPLDSFTTSYEAYYKAGPVSQIGSVKLVALPMLLELRRGDSGGNSTWLAVTEANLRDHAGMYLAPVEGRTGAFAARLSPLPGRQDGAAVVGATPHASPWRVLMIADDPGRLIESNLVFNLSDAPAIEDASWIRPGKTTFPWWNGYVLEGVDFKPGMNTATHKHYIDFCAEYGVEFHSLDGTDTAWYGGPIIPTGPTDITRAVPDVDLPELFRYARERGVRLRLWMHWRALKPQIDEAFPLYQRWGVEGVMVDFMDRDDQEMVAFYHEVAEKAARHRLTVTWHGAYKPTGMERTWPNVLTYEGVLNQEYNKWDERGTPPEHNLDVAFVRMLAGPVDYHHGGMRNVLPKDFQPRNDAPFVQGTRGHQLAMYIVYQNHRPMMVDYPAAYRGAPGLEFIVEAPTNWDETRVLHAEPGCCLVIARRRGHAWYLGGMAALQDAILDLPIQLLAPGSYEAELWLDDPPRGPSALVRERRTVSACETLRVTIPAAGGFVAKLAPARN
jgi:alpha-glucosidase